MNPVEIEKLKANLAAFRTETFVVEVNGWTIRRYTRMHDRECFVCQGGKAPSPGFDRLEDALAHAESRRP